jgi:hypothetical protein
MVAMKMRNEYVTDFVEADAHFHELHLRTFATINEQVPVLYLNKLAGRKSPVRGQRAAGAEDRY